MKKIVFSLLLGTAAFTAAAQNIFPASGNTGIGNVDATRPGYRLYVEQGILTEKVKVAVKSSADWADHVFDKNYSLPPLEQVAGFIQMHRHLPGIPAAAQMVQQGNDLGKTDAKLLEKIEGLTLYMIALHKQVQALKADNKILQQQIQALTK